MRAPSLPSGSYVENLDNKPRNILEEIVWYKDEEITAWKAQLPLATLKRLSDAQPPTRDFTAALRSMQQRLGLPGLIAEVKKASPRCVFLLCGATVQCVRLRVLSHTRLGCQQQGRHPA